MAFITEINEFSHKHKHKEKTKEERQTATRRSTRNPEDRWSELTEELQRIIVQNIIGALLCPFCLR